RTRIGKEPVRAGVIEMPMRVDDITDWQIGNRSNTRKRLFEIRSSLAVDDQHAVSPRKDQYVATGPNQHRDVAAEVLNVERGCGRRRCEREKRGCGYNGQNGTT